MDAAMPGNKRVSKMSDQQVFLLSVLEPFALICDGMECLDLEADVELTSAH